MSWHKFSFLFGLIALLLGCQVDTGRETAVSPVSAEPESVTYHEMAVADGEETIEYALVLPPDFDPDQTYPILLALPPGPQTRPMVDNGLRLYWQPGAFANGWIVVSPVAPGGIVFFRGSEDFLPEFLDNIAAMFPPEGGKFHVAGISNGGISAFRAAINMPDRFHSLVAVPGVPANKTDFDQLDLLTDIPIAMHVGGNDTGWLERMEEAEAELDRLGGNASLIVAAGEGHVIQGLSGGALLFAFMESAR
ncbi:MAG: hypothetical protein AAF614_08450 [Chloroflexota bacterium]